MLPITYWEKQQLFEIRTKCTVYLFGINERGTVQHVYWGNPIEAVESVQWLKKRQHSSFDADINRGLEEYGGWSGAYYGEPAMKVKFEDGVRDLRLQYRGYVMNGDHELVVHLRDEHYLLHVDIHYKVMVDYDLIERYIHIRNEEINPIEVEQVLSAVWAVQDLPEYRMTHAAGKWGGEFQLRDTILSEGKKVLESRMGITGPHFSPWYAIDNGKADEVSGKVWFGVLGWSGNWKIIAEKTMYGHVRISGGINSFDSTFVIAPGGTFTTPVFTGGYSIEGFGGMSRSLHRYQVDCILPVSQPRKVLYNSWEATEFNVTVQGQLELARQAARMGVERFVIDDGWFGERHSDKAGLGDWAVNAEKFPNGLQELIDEARTLGMEFGLWVEPESVNPDSELYRKHPDWVYQFPTRTGTQLRNQFSLNLGLPEVKAFVLDFMTELLSTYEISFIKWDMNRPITEPGSVILEREGSSIWIRHVEHLYEIWAQLRGRFPHVEFETCSGGGARIDIGILRYADQAWVSDNTDARDRLLIQEGYTYAYTPAVMMCWVTESPHGFNGRSLPLSFRFHSAMMGGLGIGANIRNWQDEELEEAGRYVEVYKQIRSLIARGSLYRLESLRDSKLAAFEYVSEDGQEAVVFVFLHAQHFGTEVRKLRLQGLDPEALYEVVDGKGETVHRHGSTLMHLGIAVTLRGDYASWLFRLKRLESE